MRARVSSVMPKGKYAAALAAALAVGAGTASAQEGHPLKGSWLGTWEANDVHGEFVVVVLDWDGEKISGTINPGTDDIPISSASLDPSDWTVQLEAVGENGSGGSVHYQIEGRIENLELPNRSIVGNWRHEQGSGAFEVSRQ